MTECMITAASDLLCKTFTHQNEPVATPYFAADDFITVNVSRFLSSMEGAE